MNIIYGYVIYMLTFNKHLVASVDHAFLKPWKNLDSWQNELICPDDLVWNTIKVQTQNTLPNDSLECGMRKGDTLPTLLLNIDLEKINERRNNKAWWNIL